MKQASPILAATALLVLVAGTWVGAVARNGTQVLFFVVSAVILLAGACLLAPRGSKYAPASLLLGAAVAVFLGGWFSYVTHNTTYVAIGLVPSSAFLVAGLWLAQNDARTV